MEQPLPTPSPEGNQAPAKTSIDLWVPVAFLYASFAVTSLMYAVLTLKGYDFAAVIG